LNSKSPSSLIANSLQSEHQLFSFNNLCTWKSKRRSALLLALNIKLLKIYLLFLL